MGSKNIKESRNRFVVSAFLICLLCFANLYSDNVLKSHTVEDVEFRFHRRDEKIVNVISRHINTDIGEFQKAIGFYPQVEVIIVIAPTEEYYRNLVSDYRGIIEFSQAFYSRADKTIYIRSLRNLRQFSNLRKIILHEYIHHFIDTVFYNAPLWFHEGMAVFFSGELSFDKEFMYAKDFLFGNTQTLLEMTDQYPSGSIRWNPFYIKSALAVKHLYTHYSDGFYELWDYHDHPVNFNSQFITTFKMTITHFSNLLEEHLQKRFRLEIALAFSGLIWGLLPIILLFGWLRKIPESKD